MFADGVYFVAEDDALQVVELVLHNDSPIARQFFGYFFEVFVKVSDRDVVVTGNFLVDVGYA